MIILLTKGVNGIKIQNILGIITQKVSDEQLNICKRAFHLLSIVNIHCLCQAFSASISSPLDSSPVKSAAILQAVTWFGRG